PFAANPIRCFPEYDQCLAHSLIIYASRGPWVGPLTGSPRTQQTHRGLAMQATHRNEFIQDTPPFLPVARGITCYQRTDQLISCCHTDPPHLRSPSPLLGSNLREATDQPPGEFQARQRGRHLAHPAPGWKDPSAARRL